MDHHAALSELWRAHGLGPSQDWFRFTELDDKTVLLDYKDHFSFLVDLVTQRIVTYRLQNVSERQADVYLQTQLRGLQLTIAGEEPLHGTVLSWNDKAIALIADSGSGKSTLAAALMSTGARLIGDDIVSHKATPEGIEVLPSSPLYLKLFSEPWRRFLPQAMPLSVMNNNTRKLIFEIEPFPSAFPLAGVFVLGEANTVSLERLPPVQAYLSAAQNTFATVWWPESRARAQFSKLTSLVQKVPFYSLAYPRVWEVLPRVAEIIRRAVTAEGEDAKTLACSSEKPD